MITKNIKLHAIFSDHPSHKRPGMHSKPHFNCQWLPDIKHFQILHGIESSINRQST